MNASSDFFFSMVFVAKRCQHWPKQQLLLGVAHSFQTQNIQGFLLRWKLGQGNLKTQSCPIQSPMIFASCPPGSPACAIFGNMKSESMLVRKKLSVNFGSWFLSCLSWVLKSDCFGLQEICQHVRDSGRFATHPNVDDNPQINPYLLGMKGLRCDNA